MKTPEASDGHQLLRPPLYSPPPPSFLDVVQGKHLQSHANLQPNAKTSSESAHQSHANLQPNALASSESALSVLGREGLHHSRKLALKLVSSFKDKPCVAFSISEVKALEDNCKFAFIGKFSHGRPSFTSIRTFLANLQLKGSFNPANLDKKHVLIECSCYAAFYGLWLKLVCYIDGFAMRVFIWEPSYTPAKESAMAHVWIRIEGLPLHMFDEMPLRSIANSIGKPIKIDPRNINRTMVNCARICVELDVSKQLVDIIRLSLVDDVTGVEVEGRWLQVFYDVVPKYCVSCCHIGHGTVDCKRAEPLPPVTTSRAQTYTQVWLPADRKNSSEMMQFDNLGCSSGVAHVGQIADSLQQVAGTASVGKGCSSGEAVHQVEQAASGEPVQVAPATVEHAASAVSAGHQSSHPGVANEQPKEVQLQPSGQIAVQVQLDGATDQQVAENSADEVAHQIEQVAVSVLQDAYVAQMQIATPAFATPVSQIATTPSQRKRQAGQVVDEDRTTQNSDSTVLAGAMDNTGHLAAPGQQMQDAPRQDSTCKWVGTTAKQAGCKHYRSAVEDNSNETSLQQDPRASGWVQKDGKNECTALVAWTAAAATDQATPLHLQESQVIGKVLSWADQVELEQEQVTANSRSNDHHMALEHTFELHSEKEQGAFGNFLCIPIPKFYDLSPQEQKDDTAIIMAEFYWYSVSNALEEEIVKDSKDNRAAPDSEHLPTEQE